MRLAHAMTEQARFHRPEESMPPFNRLAFAAALGGLLAVPATFLVLATHAEAASVIAPYDKDHSGELDIAEVKAAVSAAFDRRDKDHHKALDRKELDGVLSDADFDAADTDHDGKVSKDEYLAFTAKLFKDADTDHDGGLSKHIAHTEAGRTLLQMFK
jgi:hypothetical protein